MGTVGGELTREALLGWPTLVCAYQDARRGKRRSTEVAGWFSRWESRLLALRARLEAGYAFGPYRCFQVRDPKIRDVASAPFADRIVHHAIVACIAGPLERAMLPTSFACRTGKGNRAAREALMRRCRSGRSIYFAKADVRRYFPSVRHDVLLERLDRVCGDAWSRALLAALVESWHTPGAQGTGIPIGNLTSQLFANVCLNDTDHFMARTAGARGYLRYVDDMLWFGDDKPALWRQLGALAERLAAIGLDLHPKKTRLGRVADGIDFAGWVAAPTWFRLRGATKRRALRHLASARKRFRRGELATACYLDRMQSFAALASEAGGQRMLASRGICW